METLVTAGSVILDRTPFYGESGGQAGDTGSLWVGETEIVVRDTQKPTQDLVEHQIETPAVALQVGQTVLASIAVNPRLLSRRNHTATHLLHAALRKVLGNHVTQKGSLVDPDRLRFDFAHHKPVSAEELNEIQNSYKPKLKPTTASKYVSAL